MCLSAITWSGFDNFYFMFSYEETRDAFAMPHDIKILEEVFACKDGKYRRGNSYWRCFHLLELIDECDSSPEDLAKWRASLAKLEAEYDELSSHVQDTKDGSIPLDD